LQDIYSIFLKKNKDYTSIQKLAIPIIKEGKNCLVVAPTGYGKTEAAMLPLIDMVSRERRQGISILYITPLRALNRDMIRRLELLCKEVGVTIGVRHGDTSQKERKAQVEKAPEILITTPETLQSILVNQKLRLYLTSLRALVVDELHELYSNKRGAQLSVAMERLAEAAGDYQRVGISATVGDKETLARVLCGDRECAIADAGVAKGLKLSIEMPNGASEYLKVVSEKFGLDEEAVARLEAVTRHISDSVSTLVFANTRQVVEAVGSRLLYINSIRDFGGIGVHHSSLDRAERVRLEDSFKNKEVRSIIATSSLELGIDIGSIDAVVQYGSPRQSLRLAQRVGRSGHTITGTPRGYIIPLNIIDALESAVLCERALGGSFEHFSPHFDALDVMANQVRGMALESGGMDVKKMLAIVNRSFVYKKFKMEDLVSLLEFMAKQHMIGFGGTTITPGGGTKIYYYKHLSVISDVKRFVVKNMAENRIISTLDERFVANNVDEGSIFITKGLPWKVISIDEDVITVEPSTDLQAAVPDWEGEDIPVSYETAQMVGALFRNGIGGVEKYLDKGAAGRLGEFLKLQKADYTPTLSEVTIESVENYKIIYTWLGTAANDALSKVLAHTISKRLGRDVSVKASPYAVFIEVSGRFDLASIIENLDADMILVDLRENIVDSQLFRYKFVAVAKLFGMIERDALVSRSMTNRLVKILKGSPVYNEALRELMNNYVDTKTLLAFIKGISTGKIAIREVSLESTAPLTKAIVSYSYSAKELIAPITPNRELVETFSRYMLGKTAKMVCTYCGFVFSKTLGEIKDLQSLRCESCASPLIAMYDDKYKEVLDKKRSGKRLTRGENEKFREAVGEAGLISAYGPRAVIALSVYGVGLKTAARALMMRKGEQRDFFIDLIEAQKTFIRTKKYWSV
jgi:ATP-dependent Lhr-like helicase